MFHRRIRLALLVAVLVSGVIMSADAGGRKRRSLAPAAASLRPDETNRVETVTSICPIYVIFDHGTYCTWYAVQCDGDTPVEPPVLYDAACDAGPQTPCTNCDPAFLYNQQYATSFKTGYPGSIRPRSKVLTHGTAEVRDEKQTQHKARIRFDNTVFIDEVAKIDVGVANAREATVQLLSVVTMPDRSTLGTIPYKSSLGPILVHVGYEVDSQANPTTIAALVSKPHPDPAHTGVRIVTYQGNEYAVLLKAP